MSAELENQTGRKYDHELNARVQAAQLKEKENLTLAEKLILASSQRTMSYKFPDEEGIEIEVYVPTQSEFEDLLQLFNKLITSAGKPKEEVNNNLDSLYGLVSSLIVDKSITPDVLKSGQLGASFIPKFVNEVTEHEKRTSTEITAVKGFRRKRDR